MKRIALCLTLFILVNLIGCTNSSKTKNIEITKEKKQENADMMKIVAKKYNAVELTGRGGNIPAPNNLFEKCAIVTAKKGEQYVYTDNTAGYSDLYTKSYTDGEMYSISGRLLLNSFAVLTNDIIADRRDKSAEVKIYPYGSVTKIGSVNEYFYLHKETQAVTLGVSALEKGKLAILPVFQFLKRDSTIEVIDGMAVINVGGREKMTAVVFADQETVIEDISESNRADVNKLFYGTSNLKLNLTSVNNVDTLHVTIVFDKDKEIALSKAKKISIKDNITELKQKVYNLMTQSYLWSSDEEYSKALMWSKISAYSMVTSEFGKGIWAGLPWFRDNWGRDTFISVPGTLLASGLYKETKEVITNFSKYQNRGEAVLEVEFADKSAKDSAVKFIKDNFVYRIKTKENKIYNTLLPEDVNNMDSVQKKVSELNKLPGIKAKAYIEQNKNYGRIPNRVSNPADIIYNTTDGTPWMIREIYEYIMYSGDMEYAKEIYPVVKLAIESAKKNYVDKNGMLTHADADTWMDAKFDEKPWSPRGNRANDIQALWFVTLKIGSYLAEINGDSIKREEWENDSETLKKTFADIFWDSDKKVLADRIRDDESKDLSIRPNQLMVLTIPFEEGLLDETKEAIVVKNSINNLAYIYGIASLAPDDEYFHPYHITSEKYEKDAAYHNGTIWGWNAGFAVSAMAEYGYKDFAYEMSKNLAGQILNIGCLGSMSENMEALPDRKGNLVPSGTYSQAWSVAEFNRNGYQDYAGFKPDMIKGEINFHTNIPEIWSAYSGVFPFGKNGKAEIEFNRIDTKQRFNIKSTSEKEMTYNISVVSDYIRYGTKVLLSPNENYTIEFDSSSKLFYVNGKIWDTNILKNSFKEIIGELKFVEPDTKKKYPATQKSDFLREIISNGHYRKQ